MTSVTASVGTLTPVPLVNSRYQLANGFDTPTLAVAAHYEPSTSIAERDFRRSLGAQTESHDTASLFSGLGPLARERNGKGRPSQLSPSPSDNGWGSLMLSIVGNVADKMWQFCRTSAIRGFYAGGGQGYSLPSGSEPTTYDLYKVPTDDGSLRSVSPLPGRYPRDDDEEYDFAQQDTPVRAAKRLHLDSGTGWVVVDHGPSTREPTRLSARKVSESSCAAVRQDMQTKPRPASPRSASRASGRRSLLPVSRRASTACHGSRATASPQADYQTPSRRASLAPTRSSATRLSVPHAHAHQQQQHRHVLRPSSSAANGSPLSPEATAKFVQRKEKRDREADKSMRKMSRQVQDLIRQGQVALGTRFEVEQDGDEDDRFGGADDGMEVDEGFEEGAYGCGSGEGEVDGWEELEYAGK